jgi:hypothetical protein
VAAPPWPSSPRPSSPSLPPVRREKRENSQSHSAFVGTSCSPLSRQAGGRLGERGWGSEGLEAADSAPSTMWGGVTSGLAADFTFETPSKAVEGR